jgi:tripartite-type tricarboxylate transporter receptor subunit TctC
MLVGFSAGGGTDVIARILALKMSETLGQTVVVENRPGASGMVGSAAVAHSDPDGTTFVISGIPSHVVAPATSATAPFDPVKDFTHIAYVGGAPIVITAHASLGVRSLAELVAMARRSGNALGWDMSRLAWVRWATWSVSTWRARTISGSHTFPTKAASRRSPTSSPGM